MNRSIAQIPGSSLLLAAALLVAVSGTARALKTARMRLPETLAAAAETLPASGYGGFNRGRFEIGEYRGEFTRIESRFAVFDPLYEVNRGKSSFTLEGPDLDIGITAECRFRERVVNVGVLTFDAKKLAYVCDIGDAAGNPIGSLTLGEPKPEGFKARLLARASRKGIAQIGALTISIESVHQYAGSPLSSQTPVGYVLSAAAEVTGALELTDFDPTFILREGLTDELRQATLIAALGLSVLRDPANSALGD